MPDTVDVNKSLDKFFTQSSVAPVGTKDTTTGIQKSLLKTVDHNPNYFKDSLIESSMSPYDQIILKLKESAEGQKIPPEDAKEMVADLYELDRMTGGVGINFDKSLMEAYKNQRSLGEFISDLQEELYEVKRNDLKGLHQERLAEIDKLINKMKSSKVWGTLGKMFGVVGAIAGGVAMFATGGVLAPLLAAALIGLTLGNTVDNAFGDPVKKSIANKLTDGSDTKVNDLVGWFEVGIGALQLVIGLGAAASSLSGKAAELGVQAATALGKTGQASMNIATGVVHVGKAVTIVGESASKLNVNMTKATILEKETEAKVDEQELKEIMDTLRRAIKQNYSIDQSMVQIAQMQYESNRYVR